MTMIKLLATATIALVAGWFVEAARADEAYVCEGGRIVYVKMGQLERLKREDPCIAQYYGLPAPGASTTQSAAAGSPHLKPSTSTQESSSSAASAAAGGLRVINAAESGRWFRPRQ